MNVTQIDFITLSRDGSSSPPSEAASTVLSVVREGNCMGCGTCAAACPTGALRVELNTKRGGYEPLLDESCCIRCGRCLEMCPGREVLLDELSGRFLDGDFHQERLGRYRRLCLGAASDAQIRYHGASGGLVTALLIQALEAKRIDGAIVLGNDYEKA